MVFLALWMLQGCADEKVATGDPDMVDADGDGYLERVDCDDDAEGVHPGAVDVAGDGVDQDCDGLDAVEDAGGGDSGGGDTGGGDTGSPGYPDADGDGFPSNVDCDETNADIHPGAADPAEDGIDQDCSGADAVASADADGDGYASEAFAGTDCDDDDPAVNPGATETARDGLDVNCDGADFAADGLAVGDVVLAEIMYDPDAVGDGDGEWFEVVNASSYTVNLKGLVVSDDVAFAAADTFTVTTDLVAAPGDRLVFAVEGDTGLNGGISADYDYPGSGVNFNNSGDDLYLGVVVGGRTTTLDAVVYDELSGWPLAKGASIELVDGQVGASANDDKANWCLATATAGTTTDRGSPGLASSGC